MNAQITDIAAIKTHYRTAKVDGLEIFYREAGRATDPTILFLHGFPTSSYMFRDLIPLLADRFHVVAPDYPGFGYSSSPSVTEFEYTFDHLADVMEHFTDAIGLGRFALYAQDFGGPVGFRLAARRPDSVSALIVQNANAYTEGVTPELHDILVRLATERTPQMRAMAAKLFELPYTKRQMLEGVEDPSLVNPDSWQHAQWGMDRPGNKEVQYVLHANYASNFDRYGEWHAYFRKYQPPTLVLWGEADRIAQPAYGRAFADAIPGAQFRVLASAGHLPQIETPEQLLEQVWSFQG